MITHSPHEPSPLDRLAVSSELLTIRGRFVMFRDSLMDSDPTPDMLTMLNDVIETLRRQAVHVLDNPSAKCYEWSVSIVEAGELTLELLAQNRREGVL